MGARWRRRARPGRCRPAGPAPWSPGTTTPAGLGPLSPRAGRRASHGAQASISLRSGFWWMRRLPRASHLKCLTALVTYMSSRRWPASSRQRSRRSPAGPTNGWPSRSSRSPGCSPTSITSAGTGPSPKTVAVASSHSGQRRHPAASAATTSQRPAVSSRARPSPSTGGETRRRALAVV
jgi:hypothetical protein